MLRICSIDKVKYRDDVVIGKLITTPDVLKAVDVHLGIDPSFDHCYLIGEIIEKKLPNVNEKGRWAQCCTLKREQAVFVDRDLVCHIINGCFNSDWPQEQIRTFVDHLRWYIDKFDFDERYMFFIEEEVNDETSKSAGHGGEQTGSQPLERLC